MGTRGPVPKRSTERRRRNKDSQVETVASPGVVTQPPSDPDWHDIAKRWYSSLAESGQAQFFEPSDWTAAQFVAEVMTRHLSRPQPSAQLFAGIWSAMTDLLTTEASRRRVRIEVERDKGAEEPAGVTALDEYRRALDA